MSVSISGTQCDKLQKLNMSAVWTYFTETKMDAKVAICKMVKTLRGSSLSMNFTATGSIYHLRSRQPGGQHIEFSYPITQILFLFSVFWLIENLSFKCKKNNNKIKISASLIYFLCLTYTELQYLTGDRSCAPLSSLLFVIITLGHCSFA